MIIQSGRILITVESSGWVLCFFPFFHSYMLWLTGNTGSSLLQAAYCCSDVHDFCCKHYIMDTNCPSFVEYGAYSVIVRYPTWVYLQFRTFINMKMVQCKTLNGEQCGVWS